jgi:hypothetical protein
MWSEQNPPQEVHHVEYGVLGLLGAGRPAKRWFQNLLSR